MKLDSGDVLVGFGLSFTENCFVSYHKNAKIGVQLADYFAINYGLKRADLHKSTNLKISKGIFFFNKIVEPLLGIQRTLYLKYGDGSVINIVRYQKPADKIYDHIFLFETQKY